MKKVLFPILVLGLALGLALPMAAGANLDPGIVALWHLDEGSEATTVGDSSGNGNTGMIYGAAPGVAGKFGNALSFDGDDYVSVSHDATLNPTSAITVECWAELDRVDVHQVLVRKMNTYSLQVTVGLDGAGARLEGWVKIGGVWKGVRGVTGGTTLTSGQWCHFAFTYDGTNVITYVNGAIDRSNSVTGSIDLTINPLNIGRCGPPESAYCYVDGLIDEVRIWNEALTADQIALSYSGSANWLPPVTNDDFMLKDGTTLPLKFQLFDDSVLVTSQQPVSLLITGPPDFPPSPLIFELGDGVENLRWNADEHYYIANLKTKVGTWPSGFYTASVLPANGAITFELSADKGVGRGNSGK